MANEMWCPSCEKTHWEPTHTDDADSCNDCETVLEDALPLRIRLLRWVKGAIGVVVLGAIVLTPPAMVVKKALSDAPLYATRTVEITQTRPYGVIPEAAMLLIPWALVLLLMYGMATGAFPAPRRF